MSPGSDWFDDIFAGDPLRPDPPAAAASRARQNHEQPDVTDGFDDLFVDFDEPGDRAATDRADRAAAESGRSADPVTSPARPARGAEPAVPRGASTGLADDDPPPVDDDPPPVGEAAYAGEGWVGTEIRPAQDAPWETDIDTSLVPAAEMTGIWLTTESDRESPLRIDGEPIDPAELDLPAEIVDRLLDWSDQWRAEWDDAQGWLPRARIGDYEALGRWLARRVKDGAGAVDVTLQLAHLGRAGVEHIAAAGVRPPLVVQLANAQGRSFPVVGDFVTDSGVGSFSAELNAKLEGWAEHFAAHLDPVTGWDDPAAARDHATFAGELVGDMTDELGPDYRVELDLWEISAVHRSEGPAR